MSNNGVVLAELLIISDLHLGSGKTKVTELKHLLESLEYKQLVIAGDLFNSKSTTISHEDAQLVEYLKSIAHTKELIILLGNRDREMADTIEGIFGVKPLEYYSVRVATNNIAILHGDTFDPLAAIHSRTRSVKKLQKFGRQVRAFAYKSLKSSLWSEAKLKLLNVSESVAKRALQYGLKHNVDIVCCGHTHQATVRELIRGDGRKVTYLNAGAWCRKSTGYITVSSTGEAKLVTL